MPTTKSREFGQCRWLSLGLWERMVNWSASRVEQVEMSVRIDLWQKDSDKSEREDLRDGSETCYDVGMETVSLTKRHEVKGVQIFTGSHQDGRISKEYITGTAQVQRFRKSWRGWDDLNLRKTGRPQRLFTDLEKEDMQRVGLTEEDVRNGVRCRQSLWRSV